MNTRIPRIALAAALLLGSVPALAAPASAEGERVVFGAFAASRGGQTRQQATAALETQIGRKLEVVRVFEQWTSAFPDSFHTWNRTGGRTMILSVKPFRSNGSRVTWSAIANAAAGSTVDNEIRSWARRIRDFSAPIYVTLHHEPESGGTSYGTQADFIAAWRHWVDVFRAEGATNAKFMWIMTDYSYVVGSNDRRQAAKWFPGDDWLDAMAIDAYNWSTCRAGIYNAWKSLQSIIEPFRVFGQQHPSKELWLAEWASWEDPAASGRKAQWLRDATALFARPTHQQFKGISYFNSPHPSSNYPDCDWWVDTSTSSLSAFVAMGRDPLFAADGDWSPTQANQPPTASFEPTCEALVCTLDASGSRDPEGQLVSFTWEFGDQQTGLGQLVQHTFPAPGSYPVTLTVTDGSGLTNSVTVVLQVSEDPVATPITFVATAQSNANLSTHRVTIPSSVQAGDGLLLFIATNTTATINTPTGVTGWQPLGSVLAGTSRARAFWKVAGGADAGTSVAVSLSALSKANLVVSAYRGTSSASVVGATAAVAESASRGTHLAPTVNVAAAGSWVATYWSHKDSGSSSLTPPAGVTTRASGTQTGSGRVTGLLADTATPVATGAYSAGSATAANPSSYATMWTVELRPAG